MIWAEIFLGESLQTAVDLAPIILIIGVFQLWIVRQPIARPRRMLVGLAYVAVGLTLFRLGLELSLIPIGRDMARLLVTAAFEAGAADWWDYLPILAFAGLIGFTATLIEPTLIAAADRVSDLSGGALRARRLRMVVASGVALGLILGTLRIVTGVPLAYLLTGIASVLIVLALTAPRTIVPLALDSGGIATSVVTVPLIAAYGLAVAESMPNEATAADGFGLVVLALLSPVVLLLAYAQLQALISKKRSGESDAV